MSKQLRKAGRSDKPAQHIRIYHWVYDSPAWQNLKPLDRCIYLELLRRYQGSNNGRIPLSVRELADRLKVGTSSASRSFQRLQDHGFVAVSIRGTFKRKDRRTTEWRLTEFGCDATGELASKDFMRWNKSSGRTDNVKSTRKQLLESGLPFDDTQNGSVRPAKAA